LAPALITLVVLAVGAAVTLVVLHNRSVQAGPATLQVQRSTTKVAIQTIADTQSVSGTLGYGDVSTVPVNATGVVTWLPDEGSVVREGGTLYKVNQARTVLLYGKVPLYRPLTVGTKGADVKQLEKALTALGYHPGKVDRTFTAKTRTAVEKLQKHNGMTRTGVVTSQSFAFRPGPVRVGQHSTSVGAQAAPGSPAYSATGVAREVDIALDPSLSSLATVGEKVSVELPDGSTVDGVITSKGTATSSSQGSASVPVTVGFDKATAAKLKTWESATVSVSLTREIHKDVMAVPVTALVALAEGGYAVYVPDSSPAGHHLVAVTPGLYANGYVEITGDLQAGDEVEVPTSLG
jgi:peptidoglycan hydrolase-like protein with peptidoglycan-binding domain